MSLPPGTIGEDEDLELVLVMPAAGLTSLTRLLVTSGELLTLDITLWYA